MKAIILHTKQEFDAREAELHEHAKQCVPGYCAERWAEPIFNPNTGQYALALGPQVEGAVLASDVVEYIPHDWSVSKSVAVSESRGVAIPRATSIGALIARAWAWFKSLFS